MALSIGTQVVSNKFGEGVITKIITKSTGYVEVTYNSGTVKKEMAFNLKTTDGADLKKKPAKPEPKVLTPEEKQAADIQEVKVILLSVNDKWNENTRYKLAQYMLGKVSTKGHEREEQMNSMIDQWFNGRISEKQAYCMAWFMVTTGQA